MGKKVLILGSLGMLGQELTQAFSNDEKYEVFAWDRRDIDITDFVVLEQKLAALRPEIVINATGYNAVDLCEKDESEHKKALLLNRDVVSFLAETSVKLDFLFTNYSTDYVFDGALEENKATTGCCGGGCCGAPAGPGGREIGYNEESLPAPLSRYGESKYAGERAIREKAKKYYIVRLSKLFGKPGNAPGAKRSFFEIMLEAGKTKPEVQVVDSEKSCFTYAPDLALATKELVESGDTFGVYHLVNTGGVTWYEAVKELYQRAGIETKVVPVGSEVFPREARRPRCSVLLNTKRPLLRPYQEALQEYLDTRESK